MPDASNFFNQLNKVLTSIKLASKRKSPIAILASRAIQGALTSICCLKSRGNAKDLALHVVVNKIALRRARMRALMAHTVITGTNL